MPTAAFALIAAIVLAVSSIGQAPAPQAAAQTADAHASYAWASACKDCHKEHYDSWERSKHARALNRLSRSDQERHCIGCHVTGPKARVEQDGALLNGGVQCESCHGAAAAHAANENVRTGLAKKPSAASCEACHNAKSPHFKGFYYDAMVNLSHPGLKKKS